MYVDVGGHDVTRQRSVVLAIFRDIECLCSHAAIYGHARDGWIVAVGAMGRIWQAFRMAHHASTL